MLRLRALARAPAVATPRVATQLPLPALLQQLRDAGALADHTALPEQLPATEAAAYCGFDPTADSLHLGNLVQVLALARFRRAGWPVLAVVGGATAQVGDPSGRTTERSAMEAETLARNQAGLQHQLHTLLERAGGSGSLRVLNNVDWLGRVSVLEFLNQTGRHFRLSSMLAKDSVKTRLASDEGMSFTEFTYQLFQAADFQHLFRTYACCVQLGGSDQWGNITAGVELVRRTHAAHVVGVTVPLLTTASGEKLGKSAGNAVWLAAERTSPFQLFQHLMQSDDADVGKLLSLLTLAPAGDVAQVLAEHQGTPEKRVAQRVLAEHVTELVHGREAMHAAAATTEQLFQQRDARVLSEMSLQQLLDAFSDAPRARVSRAQLETASLAELAVLAGLAKSKSAARTLANSGGLYLNDGRVEDARAPVPASHVLAGEAVLLRSGKKRYALVLASE